MKRDWGFRRTYPARPPKPRERQGHATSGLYGTLATVSATRWLGRKGDNREPGQPATRLAWSHSRRHSYSAGRYVKRCHLSSTIQGRYTLGVAAATLEEWTSTPSGDGLVKAPPAQCGAHTASAGGVRPGSGLRPAPSTGWKNTGKPATKILADSKVL